MTETTSTPSQDQAPEAARPSSSPDSRVEASTLTLLPGVSLPTRTGRLAAEHVVAAYLEGARTLAAIHRACGTKQEGKGDRHIRAVLACYGVDIDWRGRGGESADEARASVRAQRRDNRAASRNEAAGKPQRHYRPWSEKDSERAAAWYAEGRSAAWIAEQLGRTRASVYSELTTAGVQAAAAAQVCGLEGCEEPLPERTGRGRKSKYCSDRHRHLANEARRQQATLARVAELQGPCEYCGKPITPGRRLKRYDSVKCNQAAWERAGGRGPKPASTDS